MMNTLLPLHQLMEKGGTTLQEKRFEEMFANDLYDAYQWCKSYNKYKSIDSLNHAWDIYSAIFQNIKIC